MNLSKRLLYAVVVLMMFVGSTAAANKVPTISQGKLDAITKRWQHILRLDDWNVETRVVRLAQLPPGTAGESLSDLQLRVMFISVLDPRDYEAAAAQNHTNPKRGKAISTDIEDTIIHELVHLRVSDITRRPESINPSIAEETTVVRITSALMAAKGK